jgi:FtsP/CotA-like multicopper oxidase with cupredoxin domain
MTRNQRLAFLGIAAVIAVVAIVIFAVGGSGDDSQDSGRQASQPTATPTSTDTPGDKATATPTATATPEPQPPLLTGGSVKKLRFQEGDTVRFRVRNDAAEEVHVHGYDIKKDLEPGKTAEISFKATITGIFEIEFEQSAQQIAELRVDPK